MPSDELAEFFEEYAPEAPAEDMAGQPAAESRAVLDASYLTTDTANAERFAELCRGRLIYVPELGWLYWDDRRWLRDVGNIVTMRWSGEAARNIYGEAQHARDDELAKHLARWADKSLSRQKREAMIALAVGEPDIAATVDQLDTDPWLFNCLNGVVDLRTGELLPHHPERYVTKLAPVEYDPEATAPLWLAFLETVLAGSTALVQYLQRIVGYSLTGLTVEQVLFLLYGVGANGKSTFLETIRRMMGDYAQQADASAFLAKRSDGPNNDIARLHGARFVSAIEVGEGRRLAEALVKQMTGGDAVAARFLHREFFEFRPSFKLWLAANHKPIVRGTDHAIWRRIRLIPFTVTIPEGERDNALADKLRGELPGILAWAVRGCLDWHRGGLQTPEAVSGATDEYRAEMDTLADFLVECCEAGSERQATAKELYGAYSQWCEQAGERPESKRWLGSRLAERGYQQAKATGGLRVWRGVGLKHTSSGASV
jgi:putative DNA primase/helicase